MFLLSIYCSSRQQTTTGLGRTVLHPSLQTRPSEREILFLRHAYLARPYIFPLIYSTSTHAIQPIQPKNPLAHATNAIKTPPDAMHHPLPPNQSIFIARINPLYLYTSSSHHCLATATPRSPLAIPLPPHRSAAAG